MRRILALFAFVLLTTAGFADETNKPAVPTVDKTICIEGQKNVALNLTSTFNYLDGRIVSCFNYAQQVQTENFNRLAQKIAAQDAEIATLKARLSKLESGR